MVRHVLHVEDDDRIRAAVSQALTAAGWSVTTVTGLAEARDQLRDEFDLVLLDLGLPDGDGVRLCREMREAGDTTPIIVITARDSLDDRVRGLDAGADDYVVKPFEVEEVLARARSVLRRAERSADKGTLRLDGLWIEPTTRRAGRDEDVFNLTPTEFDLLLFLMRRPGRVWTRDQLLNRVWGVDGGVGDSRVVDLTVTRLRKKIERDPSSPLYIATVWGVGYRLNDELS